MFRTGICGLSPKLWIVLQLAVVLFTYVQGSSQLRFSAEPRSAAVAAGGAVLLQCSTGSEPGAGAGAGVEAQLSWRWAPALPLDEAPPLDRLDEDPHRSLMPNGSLYLQNIGTGAPAGDYQCLASVDARGTIVSKIATISLPSPPVFDAEPRDVTVYPGQSAFFACSVRGRIPTRPSVRSAPIVGPLDVKIQWLKNEAPLRLDEARMSVLPSGALEIDPVVLQDHGAYRCNVSCAAYRLSNKALLTINTDMTLAETVTAPSFIAEPRSQTVIEGSPVTMDCAALGNPRPEIIWLNNGVAIDLNDLDSRFVLLGSGVLYISSVREADAGTYQCRADNREDSLDATAILDVQVPPRFIKSPADKTALEREELELECEVYGRPEPIVRWLKNGEVITPNNHDMALVNGYNLRIQGLMDGDAGMFQCVASNPAGNIQASAQLTVLSAGIVETESQTRSSEVTDFTPTDGEEKMAPSEPLEFRAVIIKPRFVTLSWVEPQSTNGDVTVYAVIYKPKESVRERVMNTTRGDVHEMNVPSLQPSTAYQFRVVAYNRHGPGPSTQMLNITTQSEEQSLGAPQDLEVEAVSPTTLAISWKPPQPVPGSKASVAKYELKWTEMQTGIERSKLITSTSHRLSDLRPFTAYSVRVEALSAEEDTGAGVASGTLEVRTPGDVPSAPPLNLTLDPQTSTSVLVQWEAPQPETWNGDLTGFKIKYRRTNRRRADSITTPADARSNTLRNLDRMATYQVRVCAFNINGSGPFTEWINVDTLQNDLDESRVPDVPSPLKTRAGAESIYVSWGPPLNNQNIKVRNYVLGWGIGVPDVSMLDLSENVRHYTMRDLEPNLEYVISLRARNQAGEGQPVYANVRTRDRAVGPPDIEGEVGGSPVGVGPRQPLQPLIPPIGLKADVLSGTAAVVYWTDMTLPKSQLVTDQRYYTVRYSALGSQRHRYLNTSHLNCMIDELRPNTQYEFTVKVVKGNRESAWSMVVVNGTLEAAPASHPRDLRVTPAADGSGTALTLHWQPPNKANGAVTGYVILYTTDWARRDRDWVVQAVVGGGTSAPVRGLRPSTAYHFKVQARNAKGYGPFSPVVTFNTPLGNGIEESASITNGKDARHSQSLTMYICAGAALILVTLAVVVGAILCCRRAAVRPPTSPDSRTKSTYQKSSASNIKPPDLWIHHDQMELKQMDKSHHSSSGDGVSGVSAMTLPRPPRDSCEYDTAIPGGGALHNQQSNCGSLDKRHYVPTYVGSTSPSIGEASLGGSSRNSAFMSTPTGPSNSRASTSTIKSKPTMSVEHFGRDISMSSINTQGMVSGGPPEPLALAGMRPVYPRTQYLPTRAHVTMDQNTPLLSAAGSSLSGTLPSQSSISSLGQPLHHHHSAVGMSPMSCSTMSCGTSGTLQGAPPPSPSPSPASEGFPADAREREQGHYVAYEALHPPRDSLDTSGGAGSLGRGRGAHHPLRSFSVPAPPPSDAPHTPHHHNKVSVTIRPTNTSPYKKPLAAPQGAMPTPLNRLQQGLSVPHSAEELEALAPSRSTERLHQEMANLEGLMKDLNAITASQFQC